MSRFRKRAWWFWTGLAMLATLGSRYQPPALGQPPEDAAGLIPSPERGWPQWRGPRRDGVSAETGLLSQWPPSGPKLLWQVAGLGKGWSSPIVVGGRVYVTGDVGDELILFAFDDRGKVVWKTTNGQAWNGPYPGSRASCVYSDQRIYHVNAHGRLACFDAANGNEIWDVDILQRFAAKNIQWGITECLLVDGNRLIVTPGGTKALMAALDKSDGRTLWTNAPLGDDVASHSSPILFRASGRRQIANSSSAHGFGVDADSGKLLWTVPLRNQFGVNAATPIFAGDQVFFVTPYAENGRAYRLRAEGAKLSAEEAWRSSLDTVTGSGVLLDGTLFAAGYRKSKWWFGLDWKTGQTLSEQKDLTTGAAVYADGRLYVFDERGTVALAKPERNAMTIVGRFRIAGERLGDAWAHPVLCDGRLYIRFHDALYCYDVRAR
jgi:outer membrane protein assembly factor BamB